MSDAGPRIPWSGIAAIVLVALVVGLIVGNAIAQPQKPAFSPPKPEAVQNSPPAADEPKEVRIQITGEVLNPGLYTLASDLRVEDAVAAAGGLTSNAQSDGVNLAAKLKDGQAIRIPARGESAASNPPSIDTPSSALTSRYPISVNSATVEELAEVPGIGRVLAERIIVLREVKNGISSIDELVEVNGISGALVRKIRPYLKP